MRRTRKNKKWIKVGAVLLFLGFLCYIGSSLVYPDVSRLKRENPKKTAFMEYREKRWKQEGKKKKIIQMWIPFTAISPYVVKAVLIAEDDKFWSHEGFDLGAIEKAIEKDLKENKFKYGASTITQQLAKNLYLSPSKNPIRKIKEAILTSRIEHSLTKRRILEIYLNVAEWGDGLFGIEAAARAYYGKPASDLGPQEAARLASVLPNPIRYRPTGDSRYVESRSEIIYNIMVKRGIVIPDYEDAMSTPDEPVKMENGGPSPQAVEADQSDNGSRPEKSSEESQAEERE
jgi:monofunctional glycosyltransferase